MNFFKIHLHFNLKLRYFGPSGDDPTKKVALFISDLGLDLLKKSTIFAADGTFATAPDPFLQLFVIRVRYFSFKFSFFINETDHVLSIVKQTFC